MYCEKCGAYNEENSKFCRGCGTPLLYAGYVSSSTQSSQSMAQVSQSQSKRVDTKVAIAIVCAAMLVMLAVAGVLIFANTGSRKVERYISSAEKYLEDENYDKAISAFEAAIRLDPQNEEAYLGLADVYVELAKEAEKDDNNYMATEYLDRAIYILEDALEEVDSKKRIEKKIEKIKGMYPPQATEPAAVERNNDAYDTSAADAKTMSENNDELFDRFINGEIQADYDGEIFYYSDFLENHSDEFEETPEFTKMDVDNDGIDEYLTSGWYGCEIFDVRDNHVYMLTGGGGTAAFCRVADYEGKTWICHSDTSHGGRQMYDFVQYNGNGQIVDSFNLYAEYWESVVDEYDENSDFTYRDKKVTMSEFEDILNSIEWR